MSTEAPEAPARPRTPGRAARMARERRRRFRRRLLLTVTGLVLAVGAAVGTAAALSGLREPATAPWGGPGEAAGPEQETLLFVQHADEGGPARSVTLLGSGPDGARGAVLFVPAGTLVDIPGVGLDRLGLAHQYGDLELVRSAVEHAVGVRVDHVAGVTDAGLAAWLDRIGGLDVEVPSRLVARGEDGAADVRFEAGVQRLDGAGLAELWAFREDGEDELAALARQQRILDALLLAVGAPEARGTLLEGGPPQLVTEADEEWLDGLLTALASAHEAEAVRFAVLPVEPFGGDGPAGASYRLREDEARELVGTHLPGALAGGGGGETLRVQVLNGVGVPGVGQAVDGRLDRAAFRIVLSDNARSFDFDTTQIIVYEEGDEALEAARRVQEHLGVGTIRVSRQPQSVVDLTIVVGADFVAAEASDDAEAGGEQAETG